MGHRYILIVNDGQQNAELEASIELCLREAKLEDRSTCGPFRLLTSRETPTLPLRGGGFIVGHLFSQDGTPVRDAEKLSELESHHRIRNYLLENCWGEYILALPATRGDSAAGFMRDPSGGLSCVYSFQEQRGFVTSHISLAEDLSLYDRRIDWSSIERYLKYPFYKSGRTGLAEIHELLPGCSLRLHEAKVSTEVDWNPWNFVASNRRHVDSQEAAIEVRRSVMSAVRTWADTDKRLVLELSGGLDSSIIGACLRDTNARVACCTMVTPTPGSDERQYAGLVSDLLGTVLHIENLDFEHMQFDFEPPADSVAPRVGPLQHAVKEVMRAAANRHGATAHISGAGGDTVFCYLRTAAPAADAFRECGLRTGISAIWNLSQLHQCTLWKAVRLTLRKLLRTPRAPHVVDDSFLSAKVPISFDMHPWFATPSDSLPGDRERIFELAGTQVFRESAVRGAARHVRMPLLSQPVMESCLKAPTWMWVAEGRNRAVARSAFAELLPAGILNRQSKGTLMGYLGATYRRMKHPMRDFLLSGELQGHGLLDADQLRRFVDGNLSPRDESFTRMFDLCMIENWVRHNA